MKYTKHLEQNKTLELVYILDKNPRIELNDKDVSEFIFERCEQSKINKFDIPFVISIAKEEIDANYANPKDAKTDWILQDVGAFHKFILEFKNAHNQFTSLKGVLKEIGFEGQKEYGKHSNALTGANGSKPHYELLLNIHRAYKHYGVYYLNYLLK